MDYSVGKNVKSYLRANGISQVFLSKKTGIPANILNERLNGKSEFKANELFLISEVLGVSLETFRRSAEKDEERRRA